MREHLQVHLRSSWSVVGVVNKKMDHLSPLSAEMVVWEYGGPLEGKKTMSSSFFAFFLQSEKLYTTIPDKVHFIPFRKKY